MRRPPLATASLFLSVQVREPKPLLAPEMLPLQLPSAKAGVAAIVHAATSPMALMADLKSGVFPVMNLPL